MSSLERKKHIIKTRGVAYFCEILWTYTDRLDMLQQCIYFKTSMQESHHDIFIQLYSYSIYVCIHIEYIYIYSCRSRTQHIIVLIQYPRYTTALIWSDMMDGTITSKSGIIAWDLTAVQITRDYIKVSETKIFRDQDKKFANYIIILISIKNSWQQGVNRDWNIDVVARIFKILPLIHWLSKCNKANMLNCNNCTWFTLLLSLINIHCVYCAMFFI